MSGFGVGFGLSGAGAFAYSMNGSSGTGVVIDREGIHTGSVSQSSNLRGGRPVQIRGSSRSTSRKEMTPIQAEKSKIATEIWKNCTAQNGDNPIGDIKEDAGLQKALSMLSQVVYEVRSGDTGAVSLRVGDSAEGVGDNCTKMLELLSDDVLSADEKKQCATRLDVLLEKHNIAGEILKGVTPTGDPMQGQDPVLKKALLMTIEGIYNVRHGQSPKTVTLDPAVSLKDVQASYTEMLNNVSGEVLSADEKEKCLSMLDGLVKTSDVANQVWQGMKNSKKFGDPREDADLVK